MNIARIAGLKEEIFGLPDQERAELARQVLPALLMTPSGLAEIDEALDALSTSELDALVERARRRAADTPEEAVATLIAEALRAARAQSRS